MISHADLYTVHSTSASCCTEITGILINSLSQNSHQNKRKVWHVYNGLIALAGIFPSRQNLSFNQASVRTESSSYGFTCLITRRTFYRAAFISKLFKPSFSSPAHLLLVPGAVGHVHITVAMRVAAFSYHHTVTGKSLPGSHF